MRKCAIGSLAVLGGFLLLISFAGAGGQGDDYDPFGSPITAAEKSLIRRSNDFGLELFRRLAAASDPDSNLLISPLSVSYALAMAYNGAAGKTKSEIAQTLRLPDMPDNVMNASYKGLMEYFSENDPSVILETANSAWYRPGVAARSEFVDNMKDYFKATVRELDFADPAGVDTINAWVADNTHDRIPRIIQPPLDPSIVMILINAVYFNAPWSRAFDPERTRVADFHPADGSVRPCSMMRRSDTVGYASGKTYQAIELPYGDGSHSMVLILPNAGYALDDMIERFSIKTWNELAATLSTTRVELRLPRFAFSDNHGLNAVLKAMGMNLPFTSRADFSQMVEGGGIWIDSVIHKTFIKVEEKGTEAAAATAVMMKKGLSGPAITFDRPFLFAVRERESDAIVFVGKIADPVFEDQTE